MCLKNVKSDGNVWNSTVLFVPISDPIFGNGI